MGIVSIDPMQEGRPASYRDIVNPQQLIYYRLGHGMALYLAKSIARNHKYDFKAVVYTGGYVTDRNNFPEIETRYRDAIAMAPMARVARALDEAGTSLEVDMGEDTEFPFVASTTDVSDGKSGGKYCFWVRVGDELMQVVAVDSVRRQLTVRRGFDGSKAQSHGVGERVFTPVYIGNRLTLGNNARRSNSWPGMKEPVAYALDPAKEATHRVKAAFALAKLEEGYDGVWWDTFQPATFNQCDPIGRGDYAKDGRSLFAWNFAREAPYTFEEMMEAMEMQTRAVRRVVQQSGGKELYMVANNIGKKYDEMKELVRGGDLLDGFCLEDSFIEPTWQKGTFYEDKVQIRKSWIDFRFVPIAQKVWESNLRELSQAARDGKEIYAMIGPAGYVSSYFTARQPNREQLERYAWASFLLTVEATRSMLFGRTISITRDEHGAWCFESLPDFYLYPIGDPAESASLEEYGYQGQNIWMRRFERGLVVVSRLEEGQQQEVILPGRYLDPRSGLMSDRLTVEGTNGYILLRR